MKCQNPKHQGLQTPRLGTDLISSHEQITRGTPSIWGWIVKSFTIK